jgi:hypothetical protein
MKRTTIHIGDTDRAAIALVRAAYGCSSDSAAIRLAVRIVADLTDQRPREDLLQILHNYQR